MDQSTAVVYEGFVEYLSDRKICGWVRNTASDEPVVVEILVHGRRVAIIRADITRQDLKDAGKGLGSHAFEAYFPEAVSDYLLEDAVQVRITGSDIVLQQTSELKSGPSETNSDVELGALEEKTSDRDTLPLQLEGATVRHTGGIVGIEDGHLIGWAVLGGKSDVLLITIDNIAVGEATASGLPAAVAKGRKNLLSHGFRVDLKTTFFDGKDKAIAVYNMADGLRVEGASAHLAFPAVTELKKASSAVADAVSAKPLAKSPPLAGSDTRRQHVPTESKRRQVAVVAWDLAHNPVGRAFLLADMLARDNDVHLVGPTFQFYGGKIWPPIADTQIPILTFPVTDLASLVSGALALAQSIKCDVVIVCKPRLASLLIGALIRHVNDCPMILDIDDHELSFVVEKTAASFKDVQQALRDDSPDLNVPQCDLWTRLSETLIPEADGIIVSNVALRRRFGGLLIRHVRDEVSFNPELYNRKRIREEFGYTDADKIILFLGTPRVHKGIFELADALERIGDPQLALCVIGTVTDKRLLAKFRSYTRSRIALHPDQPWSRLPELVSMADQVAILQDPSHPIAEFQIPAKLTDSLALGVPVLATSVPPLTDLHGNDAITFVDSPAALDAALVSLAKDAKSEKKSQASRDLYLTEFSYAVNRARLSIALDRKKVRDDKAELPLFDQLFRVLEARTAIDLPRLIARPPRADRRQLIRAGEPPRDMVFLWKQNDSDIYGRRSDMLARYMLKSGRVRRIIHFDAPLSADDLDRQAATADGNAAHQGNLVYVNTVRRILGAADNPNFIRRTYLYRRGARAERAFGRDLPSKDAYPDFVRRVLREADVTRAPLLWVCPIVFDYQSVADIVKPAAIIADIIDDQRTFPGDSEVYRQRVTGAYETVLREADFVFCNCVPIQDAFAPVRSDISVIPNGAELLGDVHQWELPEEMFGLPRPLIGYVGNLRDRLDLDLIEAVAARYPSGTIVLIGSAHGRPEIAALSRRKPNIKLLGVKLYDEAKRFIKAFDVAIMPHLKNEQSDRMNPLKLYVYFAVGVPIVTTEVANIGDLAAYVNVAENQDQFLVALDKVLAGGGNVIPAEKRRDVLYSISWDRRIADIWANIEAA